MHTKERLKETLEVFNAKFNTESVARERELMQKKEDGGKAVLINSNGVFVPQPPSLVMNLWQDRCYFSP